MIGFYITVSNGLLLDGHRKRMGSAVWEFMWLLDKVTQIGADGSGKVLGGKPIKLDEIADDLQVHRDTVSENLTTLAAEGYIDKKTAPYGIIITVKKAQKRFGKNTEPRRKNTEPTKAKTPNLIKTVQLDNNSRQLQAEPAGKEMGDVEQVFEIFYRTVNPNINYGNKTSRGAAEFLIKKYGLEKTLQAARFACEAQSQQYAPTITTPYQLKEKMAALVKFKMSHADAKGIKIAQ